MYASYSTGRPTKKDPISFMKELAIVADTADKWGINVLYDNHQWHTSSGLISASKGVSNISVPKYPRKV